MDISDIVFPPLAISLAILIFVLVHWKLRAWNTQEAVAKELDVEKGTISSIVNLFKNSTNGIIEQEWNLPSTDKNHDPLKPII